MRNTPMSEVSRKVHCAAFEIDEGAAGQGSLMRGAQDHAGRFFGLERFLPARCAQAPPVTGLQPWKAEFWHGSRKIVTARFGKLEKG